MHRATARLDGDLVVIAHVGETLSLSRTEAVALALEVLRTVSESGAAEAYGAVEWVAVGEVARLLGMKPKAAGKVMEKMQSVHRRVAGGDRYVARAEVDAWAAKVLGVTRRRVERTG